METVSHLHHGVGRVTDERIGIGYENSGLEYMFAHDVLYLPIPGIRAQPKYIYLISKAVRRGQLAACQPCFDAPIISIVRTPYWLCTRKLHMYSETSNNLKLKLRCARQALSHLESTNTTASPSQLNCYLK